MPHFSLRTKIFSVFVVLILGGYLLSRWGFSAEGVPGEFIAARMQGGLISQDIVNISNQMSTDLGRVNDLDQQKKYDEALVLTNQIIQNAAIVRNKAVELSNQLDRMTRALSSINSIDARQAALEGISDRLALINRLINYSGDLANLLNALHNRFSGIKDSAQIPAMIQEINAEVTAINNFNRQAGESMDRFDQIIK